MSPSPPSDSTSAPPAGNRITAATTLYSCAFLVARNTVLGLGLLTLLMLAMQFTRLPHVLHASLGHIPDSFSGPPTHILIMGGLLPGESGLLRTFQAAHVASRNPGAPLLLALGHDARSGTARAYVNELTRRGVEESRIHVLKPGRNTREQSLQLAGYLANEPGPEPRLLIITSPAHVRRTAACIRKTYPARLAAFPRRRHRPDHPAPLSTEPEPGPGMLLRYGVWENLHLTVNALREYAALCYYRLRGWI